MLTQQLPQSKVMQMLNAKERLPERLRNLFEILFVEGLSEEQACLRLHVDHDALAQDKSTMIRSLIAASA